ncbi:MAG TPA: PDZ domain-containing protein, partial [Gammaproteobacteria bacterium]|nr:PDZ domain-containing protein [Gammaproteobacteria bacterium]
STPSGGSVGLGFAIPIDLAKNVMAQLKAHGKVIRGYLGVLLQPLTPDLATGLGVPEDTKGVLIAEVEKGSPADQAGVQQGDVVTQFNGQAVQTSAHLQNLVARAAPGTKVELGVLRNGKTMTVPVTLGEKPEEGKASNQEQGGPPNPQKLGIKVQTLSPDLAQQLGYQGESGAVIAQVEPGSVAENAGLQRGDLIKEVNREQVRSAQDLADKIGSLKSGSTAALLVQRGDQSFFAAVEIP